MSVVLQHFTTDTNWHAALFLHAGSVGVALFFVLSGYLMGALYGAAPIDRDAVFGFWVRRLARVAPLFFVCVIAAYTYLAITGTTRPFYTVSWDMLWQHLVLWDGQSVLWTVPREVQFYLLFPIVWWGLQMNRGATALWLLAALFVLALRNYQWPVPVMQHGHFFVAGVLASQLRFKPGRAFDLPFVALLVGLIVSWPGVLDALGLHQEWLWGNPMYLLLLPALIVATAHSPLAGRILGAPLPSYVGNISYSIYLLHSPVFFSLFMFTPMGDWHPAVFLIANGAVVMLIASASYFVFEAPARRSIVRVYEGWRPKLVRPRNTGLI